MVIARLFSAIALLCYLILIFLTLHQNRHSRVNHTFALYLAAMVFWQFAAFMVSIRDDAESALIWYRLMTAGMGGQFVFYAFFVQIFLNKKRNQKFFVAGWLVFGALIASGGTNLIISTVSRSSETDLFIPAFDPLVPLVGIIAYSFLAYSIFSLVKGFQQTKSNLQRNRIKYLLMGSCAIALGSFTNLAPTLQSHPIDVAGNVINALLIAYAILRHQLLDISLVVRKGLFYSVPTVIIGAAYFLLISLAVGTFHASGETQVFLSFVVAILAALVAQPLHNKAQYWVDTLFFREKYDASLMLQRLSRSAAYVLDLDDLTHMILTEVTKTIHITKAAFFLRQDQSGAFQLTAQQGLEPDKDFHFRKDHPVVEWLIKNEQALSRIDVDLTPQFKALWGQERRDLEELGAELFIPIKAKGELVGVFILGNKLSEQPYSPDDQLTLTTLANQTAVAIENARLYWQLERTLKALTKAHNELEQRVKERTLDLAKANEALHAEIGERKRAEEAIKHYAAELERSNQELQQFAYVASHDLQEPLRMVSSYMQLLERRYGDQLQGDAKDFISFAVDGAKRMQALINDLLAYSRVGTKGKPFELISLDQVAEKAINNLKIAIEENRATISVHQLPTIYGDSTQLIQLFQNLIANAIKFHAERSPEITIREERYDGVWRVSVADNGIGIDPQYAERIFLIFQRLHTREEYSGTGIGLALCKRIIERHGGRIWVDSTPGKGSTFYFTFPIEAGVAV